MKDNPHPVAPFTIEYNSGEYQGAISDMHVTGKEDATRGTGLDRYMVFPNNPMLSWVRCLISEPMRFLDKLLEYR